MERRKEKKQEVRKDERMWGKEGNKDRWKANAGLREVRQDVWKEGRERSEGRKAWSLSEGKEGGQKGRLVRRKELKGSLMQEGNEVGKKSGREEVKGGGRKEGNHF